MKWVVNCKKEEYDVLIARPSKFGNPYSHQFNTLAKFRVNSRSEAIFQYENWLYSQPELVAIVCRELKGKILGCYCEPLPCHGELLCRIANNSQLCLPLPDGII